MFGPDSYLNYADNKKEFPKLLGLPMNVTLLPIMYISLEEGDVGAWDLKAADTDLVVLVVSKKTDLFLSKEEHLFTVLPSPTLAEVASASSSALRLAGSPTIFKKFDFEQTEKVSCGSLYYRDNPR